MSSEPDTVVGESERLHSFHQSLRAAVVAGVQLDLGAVSSNAAELSKTPAASNRTATNGSLGGTATLSKLDRLQPLLDEWVTSRPFQFTTGDRAASRSMTAEDADSGLPTSYLSAYRSFAESERMDLVLDSLSLRRSIAQDLAGTVRPVWFYLAAMSLVATIGIVIFAEFSLPRLAAMRDDLTLMPTAPMDENWLSLPRVGWLVVALPLLSLVLVVLGFTTRGSAFIAGCLGGRGYRSARTVAAGARIEQAIWRQRDDAGNETLDCETRSDMDRAHRETRARRVGWSLVADSASSLAQHRILRMRVSLPTLLVAILGGGGVLLYGLLLFGPLVMLIHDLATIPTDTGIWP